MQFESIVRPHLKQEVAEAETGTPRSRKQATEQNGYSEVQIRTGDDEHKQEATDTAEKNSAVVMMPACIAAFVTVDFGEKT